MAGPAQMQKVGNGIFLIVFIGISQNLALLLSQREKKQRKLRLERESGGRAGKCREVKEWKKNYCFPANIFLKASA